MDTLRRQGFEVGPPGIKDSRHPLGHFDWMEALRPQIDGSWPDYLEFIDRQEVPFAFKLQSGIIHWGAEAVRALPDPRVVTLHRAGWREQAGKRSGAEWVEQYEAALGPFLAEIVAEGISVEAWTMEELVRP
jgi:hypothetical protein